MLDDVTQQKDELARQVEMLTAQVTELEARLSSAQPAETVQSAPEANPAAMAAAAEQTKVCCDLV